MKQIAGALLIAVMTQTFALFAKQPRPEVLKAMHEGAMAEVHLKVLDDRGLPVTNASVRAVFDMLPVPRSVYGKTDTNGVCIARGKTNGNYIEFFVGKKGYYGSQKKITLIEMGAEHDVKDGKWQHYGDEQKIVLRRIISPCHLVDIVKWIYVPRTNEWIGFDMNNGDFVQPFGLGEDVDFEVKVAWDGLSASQCRQCVASVRFVDEKNGGYFAPKSDESDFPFDYRANTNKSLEVTFKTINRDGDFNLTHRPFPKDEFFVTRTRCKLNADGELISANYGILRRFDIYPSRESAAVIDYSGAFNPTANDTNLEDIETAERSRHFIQRCEPPHEEPKKSKKWFPWK